MKDKVAKKNNPPGLVIGLLRRFADLKKITKTRDKADCKNECECSKSATAYDKISATAAIVTASAALFAVGMTLEIANQNNNILVSIANQQNESNRQANRINQQPFLDLELFKNAPANLSNKGLGVAVNIFVIRRDYAKGQVFATSEKDIRNALAIGASTIFDVGVLKSLNIEEIKSNMSTTSGALTYLSYIGEQLNATTSWWSLSYQDLLGNHFATVIYDEGMGYDRTIRFQNFGL